FFGRGAKCASRPDWPCSVLPEPVCVSPGADLGFLESDPGAFAIAEHILHPESHYQDPEHGQQRRGQDEPPNSKEASEDGEAPNNESWGDVYAPALYHRCKDVAFDELDQKVDADAPHRH